MSGKCRPCLRIKTLCNVWFSSLSQTDKNCITEVFDRFEEQEAEIEELKKVVVDDYATEYDNKIKAEAVKEFAENLETALSNHFGGGFYKCHCRHVIDNLLKETVGD